MILGGANVYREALPIADRFLLTVVHHDFEGDTYFPAFAAEAWKVLSVSHFDIDERNRYPYSIWVMEKDPDYDGEMLVASEGLAPVFLTRGDV